MFRSRSGRVVGIARRLLAYACYAPSFVLAFCGFAGLLWVAEYVSVAAWRSGNPNRPSSFSERVLDSLPPPAPESPATAIPPNSAQEVRKREACIYSCRSYCDPSDKAWEQVCFADCPHLCDEIKDMLGDYY